MTTERQQIEATAKANGWSVEQPQITAVFRRRGVAITVEYAGPRDGYERFNFAKRRDDYGTVRTMQLTVFTDWLCSVPPVAPPV